MVTRALLCVSILMLSLALAMALYMYTHVEQGDIMLKGSEWTCTASHNDVSVTMAGDVTIPMLVSVCDNWKRK